MPLPFDLASVAWLMLNEHTPTSSLRTWMWTGSVWVRHATYVHARDMLKRALMENSDLHVVVRDQQRHIANLEAELRPHLVERVEGEQGAMA